MFGDEVMAPRQGAGVQDGIANVCSDEKDDVEEDAERSAEVRITSAVMKRPAAAVTEVFGTAEQRAVAVAILLDDKSDDYNLTGEMLKLLDGSISGRDLEDHAMVLSWQARVRAARGHARSR